MRHAAPGAQRLPVIALIHVQQASCQSCSLSPFSPPSLSSLLPSVFAVNLLCFSPLSSFFILCPLLKIPHLSYSYLFLILPQKLFSYFLTLNPASSVHLQPSFFPTKPPPLNSPALILASSVTALVPYCLPFFCSCQTSNLCCIVLCLSCSFPSSR